jgi:hypothetical protein
MIQRCLRTLFRHPHPLLPEGVVKLNGVLPVSEWAPEGPEGWSQTGFPYR